MVNLNVGSGPRHYNSFLGSDNLLENNLAAGLRGQLPKNVCPIYKIRREVLEVAYREKATAAHNVKMGEMCQVIWNKVSQSLERKE